MRNIDDILAERQATHGDFQDVAKTFDYLISTADLDRLSSTAALALNVIFQKIARIVNGDATFMDHWADIAGYAQLALREIEKNKQAHVTPYRGLL